MNQRRAPRALPIALTLLVSASTGCASMQQRVTESENRAQTLEAQVADLQATQQDVINMITMLRADLEDALDPIRATQASGGADLRSLETDLSSLQEQVRILTEQLAAYDAAAAIATATPPAAPSQTERGVAMPPAAGAPALRSADPVAGNPEAAASADEQLFNTAYGDYTAGEYVLAISGFEELVGQYPDSPRAPDALYWIGESLAAQDLHAEARRRFLDVTQEYPGSLKEPDAVLRAALEAVEMGQVDDAVRELRQLVAAYANSDAALIGCMQLDRLGQELPTGCRLP